MTRLKLVAELNETLAVAADRFRCSQRADYFERASLGTVVISRERQIIGTLFDDAATVVEPSEVATPNCPNQLLLTPMNCSRAKSLTVSSESTARGRRFFGIGRL